MRIYPILSILAILLLGACKGNKPEAANVFRTNMHAGISSLDPAFSKDQNTMWACAQLFNGLVQTNDQLDVVPAIAKSWDISTDGLTYTFHLRDDVYFHDHAQFEGGKGRKVVAADFVYSFDRIIDTTVASPGGWLFLGKVRDSSPFEATDDHTFILHLKVPFKPMPGLLTLPYCSVVPREVVDYYGKDFRTNPVGTGPFRLKLWDERTALVLEKNPNYWETKGGQQLPSIDGVRFSFLADRGVEFSQFEQGRLDFVSGIDPSFKDKLLTRTGELQEAYKGKFTFIKSPYLNTEYLGISMGKQSNAALQKKEVRQAINYAIDRQKLITYLRNGIGKVADAGMIPAGLPGYDPLKVKGYTYDPQKAKALLASAGYPGGKDFPVITLHTNPSYMEASTFVAKELEHVGIPVKLENTPPAFLREMMRKNDVSFFRASWLGDYPDGENYLALFYGKYDAPPNYTFFRNAAYDRLYGQVLRETDPEIVIAIYQQMERIVLDEAPVVPLYYDEVVHLLQPRVQGWHTSALNMLVLKDIRLK
jgi:oligopeptide transport system substrate-binding protein